MGEEGGGRGRKTDGMEGGREREERREKREEKREERSEKREARSENLGWVSFFDTRHSLLAFG